MVNIMNWVIYVGFLFLAAVALLANVVRILYFHKFLQLVPKSDG